MTFDCIMEGGSIFLVLDSKVVWRLIEVFS